MPELHKKRARRAASRRRGGGATALFAAERERMCRFVHQTKYRVTLYAFDPSYCVCYGEFWGFEDASSGEKNISYTAFVIFAGRLGAIFLQTGWVARVVLLILLFLSLFSWAIILQKYRMFATLEPRTKRFMQLFRTGRGLPDPNTLRAGSSGSPFVNVYDAGYRELEGQLAGGNPHPGKLKNPRAVLVEMQLASADEVRSMESWMPWLATIGSISTFIGLFGTVWGVMDAFAGLSEVGQASLQAVAPGIADALITTAAGLFAAIPAVIAYNIYLHRIRDFALRMDNFATEFVSKIETLYS